MKHTRLSLKSLAITAAGCALLGVSATAFAVPIITNPQPFTIDEGSITGTSDNVFTATKFIANYNEIFTADSATEFTAKVIFGVSGYAFENSTSTTYINGPEPDGYNLYGFLTSSGTYDSTGGVTTFTATSNTIQIFVDPDSDTVTDLPTTDAHGAFSRSNAVDDDLLASASDGFGQGQLADSTQQAQGNFGILFSDFTLTAEGLDFFISPRPFYMDLQATGQFNPFVPSAGNTNTFNGSVDGVFGPLAVPAPGSLGLALLGMGLLGLGFMTKRSQSSKTV